MGGFRTQLTMRPKRATGLQGPLTVNTTPVFIPSSWPQEGDSSVLICNNGADVLFGIGTDPTTAPKGIKLLANQTYLLENLPGDISRIRFVRITGSDGLLSFHFFTE